MSFQFEDPTPQAIPLHVLAEDQLPTWLETQPLSVRNWVAAQNFTGKIGQALVLPDASGQAKAALAGFGSEASRARGRFHLAASAAKLPVGVYAIAGGLPAEAIDTEVLGWALSAYRYDRYATQPAMKARLVAPDTVNAARIVQIAQGEQLTRDLINTPASDMGPPDLEHTAQELAQTHGAACEVTVGDDLITNNFPMIHTVGRAADRAPRLIDLKWGSSGPKLTLVGKGVCFDTGGLNLKPGASMGLMKKDMGGAAAVLGLAHMIMATGMKVKLRVLIPSVENSVSSNAFRPQDILTSRKGLTVEVNNTDAEGRLVLADALALADEDNPDFIISMATLTGAARVAVGPDLAPYYCDDMRFVSALETAALHTADPVWRMPFHTPYEAKIEPGIADLDNAPSGGFAGSITAALFLRRFVDRSRYAHFDIYGWQPAAAPARPKGGVGQATRALLEALPSVLNK